MEKGISHNKQLLNDTKNLEFLRTETEIALRETVSNCYFKHKASFKLGKGLLNSVTNSPEYYTKRSIKHKTLVNNNK